MRDPVANYVLQTALKVAEEPQASQLRRETEACMVNLRRHYKQHGMHPHGESRETGERLGRNLGFFAAKSTHPIYSFFPRRAGHSA